MAELAEDRRANDWVSLGYVIAAGGASVLMGPEPLKKLRQSLTGKVARAGGSAMETLARRMKAAGLVKEAK